MVDKKTKLTPYQIALSYRNEYAIKMLIDYEM
jgi:hypothetical protein